MPRPLYEIKFKSSKHSKSVRTWQRFADSPEQARQQAETALADEFYNPVLVSVTQMPCKHPPSRLYSWYAYDDTLVVCCCECGQVLKGAADLKG